MDDLYTLEATSLRAAADWCRDQLLALQDCGALLTAEDHLAGQWWTRMRARLLARADRLLYSTNRPTTEQQAHALIKQIGADLLTAGQALDKAAVELNRRGGGVHAGQAKRAALNALRAAEGLA